MLRTVPGKVTTRKSLGGDACSTVFSPLSLGGHHACSRLGMDSRPARAAGTAPQQQEEVSVRRQRPTRSARWPSLAEGRGLQHSHSRKGRALEASGGSGGHGKGPGTLCAALPWWPCILVLVSKPTGREGHQERALV